MRGTRHSFGRRRFLKQLGMAKVVGMDLAQARFGLRRHFEYYNRRRRHRSLGRKTPAAVYGLAKEGDFGRIKTDGRRSAVDLALTSVALRAPLPRAG